VGNGAVHDDLRGGPESVRSGEFVIYFRERIADLICGDEGRISLRIERSACAIPGAAPHATRTTPAGTAPGVDSSQSLRQRVLMIAGAPAPAAATGRPQGDLAPARERLLYLDNLRTFLTGLVICHHCAVALGGAGAWYYVLPPPPGSPAPALLTLFLAVNQSFFMSLFFAISAYVTPASYDAKGPRAFLRDRFKRLGIPLVVYFFVLNPLLVFLVVRLQGLTTAGLFVFLGAYYRSTVGPGPLWFVLALLVFGSVYAGWRVASGLERERTGTRPFPDRRTILRFVVAIGIVAFVVRLFFPTGWNVLGLQLGYFALYVAFFVFGIWAHGNGWLARLDRTQVRFWGRAAWIASAAFVVAVVLGGGPDTVSGGMNVPALAYAMWEPWLCVAFSLWLLVLFRERFATQGALARRLTRSAYTAYIIHPFLVVCGTALVALLAVDPLLRFPVLCVLAVTSTFALSDVIRRVPGLSRIL
jgi:glucans biosynthesis protein C